MIVLARAILPSLVEVDRQICQDLYAVFVDAVAARGKDLQLISRYVLKLSQ